MSGESGRPTVAGPSDSVPIYRGQGEACVGATILTVPPENQLEFLQSEMRRLGRATRKATLNQSLLRARSDVMRFDRELLVLELGTLAGEIEERDRLIEQLKPQILALQEEIMLANDARQEVEGE